MRPVDHEAPGRHLMSIRGMLLNVGSLMSGTGGSPGNAPPPLAGALLLEDGASFLLLEDDSSHLLFEG